MRRVNMIAIALVCVVMAALMAYLIRNGTSDKSLKIMTKQTSVDVGETTQLTMKNEEEDEEIDSQDEDLTWKSSDKHIATVDSTGLVTGVEHGTVEITGTYRKGSDTITITVEEGKASARISVDTTDIHTGEQVQATFESEGNALRGDDNLTWESSDTDIANVSNSGLVTGMKEGTATIKGTYRKKIACVEITVNSIGEGGTNGGNGGSTDDTTEQADQRKETGLEDVQPAGPVDDGNSDEIVNESEPLIQPTQMGEIGNLFINISEGGMMQIVGDRVYYTNPEDDFRIYSMDFALQDKRLECSISSFYLNYRDNALIFSGADGGDKNLFRMELDSSAVSRLSHQCTYEPKVVGDTIFYDDVDENYSLYRCNLDGSGRRRISPGVVFYSCIVGDTIYYLDTQDDYHLYSMDVNGGNKRVLLEKNVRELSVQGDTLYLSMREGGILSYEIQTGEIRQISSLPVASLVAAEDGWLYFANLDRERCLFKMTTSGEKITKLSNDPVAYINVVSNLISFEIKDTGEFYWMLTDGSHYQQIQ